METIVKRLDVKKMKNDIKSKVEEQKFLKSERTNGKTMHPSVAQSKHFATRKQLRLMYAAYGLIRGKSFSQTENHYPEENHPLKQYQYEIDKLVEKYTVQDAE